MAITNLSQVAQATSFIIANEHGEMLWEGNWEDYLKQYHNKYAKNTYQDFTNQYWKQPGYSHEIYLDATREVWKRRNQIIVNYSSN